MSKKEEKKNKSGKTCNNDHRPSGGLANEAHTQALT